MSRQHTGFQIRPIGWIRSPFREKFGIPRQPLLVEAAEGVLELLPEFARPEALQGIEGYSHLWLEFVFHRHLEQGWQPRVRPPRLGGNKKVGVFASRSPFRPNPLGLSLVKLLAVEPGPQGMQLRLGGLDLLDGTPVIDIKPYLPYVEALPEARAKLAPGPPQAVLEVAFSERARRQLAALGDGGRLAELIERLLELDPRPAYSGTGDPQRIYGMRLQGFDVRWRVTGAQAEVVELRRA